jgi:antitoxin MazE
MYLHCRDIRHPRDTEARSDVHARIQKWGNSLALRIPKALATEIQLRENTPVELSLRRRTLVVRRVREDVDTLDALLARVTPDNLHGEVGTGPAVGREVW